MAGRGEGGDSVCVVTKEAHINDHALSQLEKKESCVITMHFLS